MRIFLLEPFFTGSHAAWATGYSRYSQHEVHLFTLKGKYWKWRMQGGAIELAEQVMNHSKQPDLILATDMLDLSTFWGLARNHVGRIPTLLYFHENQLTYPWSTQDQDRQIGRDRHYAFINYRSALAADHLLFNSAYHLDSFHNALEPFLKAFPDNRGLHHLKTLRQKSTVLPLGLNLAELDTLKPTKSSPNQHPLILWNHRWEYDKNPEAFFQALYQLADQGLDFQLAVLGEKYQRSPAIFKEAKHRLSDQIVHWGYARDRAEYVRWLWQADLLPVTAIQDFFGISVVEAAYCQTQPLLPDRLAYPEHFPQSPDLYYQPGEELADRIVRAIAAPADRLLIRQQIASYDWAVMASVYDRLFEEMVSAD